MLDDDFRADGRHAIQFVHILAFEGDTAIRPILIIIYCHFIVGPGAMDGDAVPGLGRSGDQALCFSFIELGHVRCRGVVEVHDLVPFFVRSFPDDVIGPFGCFPVSLHHFIFQSFIPEYGGIGGIPALFVEDLQLVAAFDDEEVDLAFGLGMEEAFVNSAMSVSECTEGKKK